jgi:hypothetical protein
MTSPVRRRAVLWALLPVLAVLNFLVWTDGAAWLSEHRAGQKPWPEFTWSSDGWIELDAQDHEHIEAGLLPVQVVDGSSGAAVANTPVWIESGGALTWRMKASAAVNPPKRDPDLHTDARGICWISLHDNPVTTIWAARPDGEPLDFGSCFITNTGNHDFSTRAGAIAATVKLRVPQIELRVRVRDREGRTIENAQVFLKNYVGGEPIPMLPMRDGETWVTRGLPNASDGSGMVESLGLRLGVGTEDGPSVPLRREHFRGKPVEIEVAKYGELEIHVRNQEDRPHPSALPIRVLNRANSERWNSLPYILAPRLTANGMATISAVPLRQRWLVGAPLLEDERYFFVEVDGPRDEGETIRVDLDLSTCSRRLRGRLATRDGAPLASSRAFAVLELGDALTRVHFQFTTEADGGFTFLLPLLPGVSWERLRLDISDDGHRESASAVVALAELSDRNDLGVVVVEPEESRGIVRVVDDRGQPLGGVSVWLRPLEFQDSGAPGPWLEDGTASGSFTITDHSVYGDPPFGVLLQHPLYLGAEGVLEREGDLLTLQMSPAARVRGRVLLPKQCDAAIEILPALPGQAPWNASGEYERTSVTSPLGFFDCGPYIPGSFDLELRIAGILMARASGVLLVAGDTLAPAEFQDLDLRHYTPMRVRLAHAPSRVRNDDLMLQVEYADGRRELLTGRNLLLPPDATRVQVDAEGCQTVWLPVAPGTSYVTLEQVAE